MSVGSRQLGRPQPGSASLALPPGALPLGGREEVPERFSAEPVYTAGRAILLTPCGPPQGLHQAHCSRPLLRPDSARPLHKAQARQHRPPAPTCAEPPPGTDSSTGGRPRTRRRRHCAPRGGATPRRARARTHTTTAASSDARASSSIAEKPEVLEARARAPGARPSRSGPARAAPGPHGAAPSRAQRRRSPRAPGPSARGLHADGQAATIPRPHQKRALPSRSGGPGQGALEPHQPHSEAVQPELSTLTRLCGTPAPPPRRGAKAPGSGARASRACAHPAAPRAPSFVAAALSVGGGSVRRSGFVGPPVRPPPLCHPRDPQLGAAKPEAWSARADPGGVTDGLARRAMGRGRSRTRPAPAEPA
ncbi:uncharacterized protein [Ovis canadensis]|uniref:uncharacterized protein n=1 Tax=Ovis canadensis TaxID=37174 RepID=UPI0037527094